MLLEVRKLIFSDDLLQRALLTHCAKEKIDVPNSQIQKIRVNAKPNAPTSVVIEFVTADPSKPYEVNLNEQFVLTAMILACKAYRVPLPRDAVKIIQVTDKGLAMMVSMKIDTPVFELDPEEDEVVKI